MTLQVLQPLTVLIDDVPCFRDGRPCRVARGSLAGVALLTELRDTRTEHLWLDHDLGGDDTIWPVMRLLEDASLAGRPFDIGMAHVQAARSGPGRKVPLACTNPLRSSQAQSK